MAAAPALSDEDVAEIQTALKGAPAQGFEAGAFGEGRAEVLLASSDPRQREDGKARLADAVVAYAAAQHGQRLAAGAYPRDWAIRPASYDAREEFATALGQGRLSAWLADLPPADPSYRRLLDAYRRYKDIAARGGWPHVPAKSKPGDTGPAVAALRARLAVEDPAAATGTDYDDALKAAVMRAQARLGLDADGVAGRTTLAALNVGADERVRQIAANLERRRWMPRASPPFRGEVNIADASFTLFAPGEPPVSMRAVVGQPTWRTPMLLDHIVALVLNPPWNVPPKIARKEVWPKIRKTPGYAAREGFVVKAGGRLQQLPGPRSALGAIKFELANPFDIYLHDTPDRGLFDKPARMLSHGCIRLQQPDLLAKRLLKDDPSWAPDILEAALLSGRTIRIALKNPPVVYVTYWTVLPAADGTVGFRADAYGWDRALTEMLAAGRK